MLLARGTFSRSFIKGMVHALTWNFWDKASVLIFFLKLCDTFGTFLKRSDKYVATNVSWNACMENVSGCQIWAIPLVSKVITAGSSPFSCGTSCSLKTCYFKVQSIQWLSPPQQASPLFRHIRWRRSFWFGMAGDYFCLPYLSSTSSLSLSL